MNHGTQHPKLMMYQTVTNIIKKKNLQKNKFKQKFIKKNKP